MKVLMDPVAENVITLCLFSLLLLENGRERLCGKYSFSVPEGIIQ